MLKLLVCKSTEAWGPLYQNLRYCWSGLIVLVRPYSLGAHAVPSQLARQFFSLLPLAGAALGAGAGARQAGLKLHGHGATMHERLLIGLSLATHKDPDATGPNVRLALKLRHSTALVWTPKPQVALQALQSDVTQVAALQVLLPGDPADAGDLGGPPTYASCTL